MTSLWARDALPRLTDLAMRGSAQDKERARFVPLAAGTVLEVGAGSGLAVAHFPIEYLACSAEHIPLPDNSADAVVSTWTLGSISDPHAALREMKRILKVEGRAWQDRINPIWKRVAGGCHLTRKIDELLVGTERP